MTAAAIAASVAVAAVSAGVSAGVQKNAAGKAAKAQQAGAQQAGVKQQQASDQANALALEQYQQDLQRQQEQLGIATGRLDPYTGVGGNALQQLGSLTSSPHGYIPYKAGSGTLPALAAQIAQWKQAANQAYADNQTNKKQAIANYDFQTLGRLNAQDEQLKQASDQADQASSRVTAYSPAQMEQAAAPNGGELYRDFNVQDYKNDPTSGGKAPPNLTKNFDEVAFLKQGGHTLADLTRAFDQTGFLKAGGHTLGDLTSNFDRAGYLKKAGFNEADLARKFGAKDFQVDPGYAFRKQQGNQGIENSAAAAGGQLSGATLKALAKYNSDLGSQEYGNAFSRFQNTQAQAENALGNAQSAWNGNRQDLNNSLNNAFSRYNTGQQNLNQNLNSAFDRFGNNRNNARDVYNNAFDRWNGQRTNQFNRLANIAGIGQQAATQQGGWGMQYAGNASNASSNYSNTVGSNLMANGDNQAGNLRDSANARSAGYIASGNAINSGIGGVSNAIGGGLANYATMKNDNENYNKLITALRR